MKVFLSYGRQDEAIAHLLAYILTQHGIRCFIDRQLPAGKPFDPILRQMIKNADLVLVLLTKTSISSDWVNQEIGFALAHDKPIWPLAMENDIQPQGMLSTAQSYSLFDWSDASRTIDNLIKALHGVLPNADPYNHYRELGADQVIAGKVERTRFLIARLEELLNGEDHNVVLYLQAAFSSFAISDDLMYKEAGRHSDEYMGLLLKERELLSSLGHRPGTILKMILWPVRAYNREFMEIRYQNLITWMKEVQKDPTIDYVCAQYVGPTRLILRDEFCIEGFKLHHSSGYEMSVVKYERSRIEDAIREFEFVHNQAKRNGQTKQDAIRQIESISKSVLQPFEQA